MIVRPGKPIAKKSRTGAIAAVLVVVAAAAVGGWYFLLRGGPESTVKAYLRASESNDATAMKATLSAESLKLMDEAYATDPTKLTAMVFPPGSTYAVGAAKIDGNKATVPVKYTQSAGSGGSNAPRETETPFSLVKEEGQWKVDLVGTAFMAGLSKATGELAKGVGDAMNGLRSRGGSGRSGNGGTVTGR